MGVTLQGREFGTLGSRKRDRKCRGLSGIRAQTRAGWRRARYLRNSRATRAREASATNRRARVAPSAERPPICVVGRARRAWLRSAGGPFGVVGRARGVWLRSVGGPVWRGWPGWACVAAFGGRPRLAWLAGLGVCGCVRWVAGFGVGGGLRAGGRAIGAGGQLVVCTARREAGPAGPNGALSTSDGGAGMGALGRERC